MAGTNIGMKEQIDGWNKEMSKGTDKLSKKTNK